MASICRCPGNMTGNLLPVMGFPPIYCRVAALPLLTVRRMPVR